jgi:large subunit ribosomal protein L28
MAQICDVCGKRPSTGHNVSHSNRKSPRRWNLNLKVTRALVNGAAKRLRVCTRCIRSGRVTKVA